jgi:hypothetical protein
MATVKTGDVVKLADGTREKELVVLGFKKNLVLAVEKDLHDDSVAKYGSFQSHRYGFGSWPIRPNGAIKGFWQMLKQVNGCDVKT